MKLIDESFVFSCERSEQRAFGRLRAGLVPHIAIPEGTLIVRGDDTHPALRRCPVQPSADRHCAYSEGTTPSPKVTPLVTIAAAGSTTRSAAT